MFNKYIKHRTTANSHLTIREGLLFIHIFIRPRLQFFGQRDDSHFAGLPNFSFSKQISSMRSVSTTMRSFNVTLHGFVYALGSSTVTWISRCPKSGRRISSRTLAASVITLPLQSIHVSSRSPIVSITSVSPDHFADEYPCHEGVGSLGRGLASVNTWRYPPFISVRTTKRLGECTNFNKCESR